jgi:lipopolysaccharide transport system permease protein
LLPHFWSHPHLIFELTRRQFTIRYRQSFGGLTWAILIPLATLGAANLVFHEVAGISSGKSSYAILTLAALIPWTFFANSINVGVPSIVSSHQMVTRLVFPKSALPLSAVGLSFVDLAISATIFLAFLYGSGEHLPLSAVWVLPLLLLEIVLIVGVVLLGSAINVFARDIRLAVPMIVQLWLFITPVMYPLRTVSDELRPWFLANPMTGLVEAHRQALVYGNQPQLELLVPALIGAGALLLIGSWYFAATESRFADVV